MKIVSALSGGMDSTTLAYWAKSLIAEKDPEGYSRGKLILLSFDYGQRHRKELAAAFAIADGLDAEYHVVKFGVEDLKHATAPAPLATLLSGSALTDDSVPVPEGHYADESMKATVVPNRNAIFLSIAYGVAVARGAEQVLFGAHAGDHAIYPDCRPAFVQHLSTALQIGSKWDDDTQVPIIVAPFIYRTKTDIARLGSDLNVPFEKTWSCYKGGDVHCGKCGTCVERKEAFKEAGVPDPTVYEAAA